MGSKKAPKQKESVAERERANIALKRLQEWETDGYKDLEQQGLNAARIDHTARLQGVANADTFQAANESAPAMGLQVGQGNYGFDQNDFDRGVTMADNKSNTDATIMAEGLKDTARMNMAKVGQDVAMTTDAAFSDAARRGASQARTRVEANTLRNRARMNALASMAGGAAMGYTMRDAAKGSNGGGVQNSMPEPNPKLSGKSGWSPGLVM